MSAIGYLPKKEAINTEGLGDIDMEKLLSIPKDYWLEELQNLRKYWDDQVGQDLPGPVNDEFIALQKRLEAK